MNNNFQRIDRISEEVRREVDRIIREDLNDPRISGTFSVTHADVMAVAGDPTSSAASGFVRYAEAGERISLQYSSGTRSVSSSYPSMASRSVPLPSDTRMSAIWDFGVTPVRRR